MLGMPLDVALQPLHYFLLQLEELGHFIFGGHRMCGAPSVSVLLITVGTGTQWSAGPIFLRASLAQAACLLGWPHSGFAHFVATTALALTVPLAFRVLPAFAAFAAFTLSTTLATCPTVCPALAVRPALAACPALAVHPVQLLLSIRAVPGPRMSPIMVFAPFMLGMLPDGGVFRVSLLRGPGLVCVAPHPVETTAAWPLSDQSAVGVGGPSP